MEHLMDIEEMESMGYTFSQAEKSLRETGSVSDAITYLSQSMKKKEITKGKAPVHSPPIAPMVQKTVDPIQPKVLDEKEAPVDSPLAETTTALHEEEEATTPALPLMALRDSRLPRHGEQHSFSTPLVPYTALNGKKGMQKDDLVGSLAKSESVVTKEKPMPRVDELTAKEAIVVESASEEDIMKMHEWVHFGDTEEETSKTSAPLDVDTDSSRMSNSRETATVSRDGVVCDNIHDIVRTETLEPRDETRPGAFAVTGLDGIDQADNLVTVSQQTSRDPSPVTAHLVDPDEENQILEQRLEEELQAEHERAPVAQVVKMGWDWRRVACVVGAVLILLAVTLGVTLKLTLPKSSDEAPTPDPPPADIVELLSPVSFDNGSSLMNYTTPQFAAAWWLAGNAHLKNYTDEQKIQRYALATLYHSTNGPKWNVKKHWLSDLDECMWFGKQGDNASEPIECVGNRTVKSLIFKKNNMEGTIPDEVAFLHDSLIELVLDESHLRGDIPTTVGMLTKLTHLNLRRNKLTGPVPTTLGLLKRLEECRLFDNRLTGSVPTEIGRLANLTYFRISENNLVGPLPETALGLLTSMESLYFFENHLTGHIPTSLALLTELNKLRLEKNSFTGHIPSALALMSALEVLDIHANNFTGPISTIPWGQLATKLEEIDLSENQLTGTIPTTFGLLSRLKTVNFYLNKLNGTVPTSIGQLVALEEMFLDYNSLSGPIPTEIALLRALENLDSHANNFTGPISTIPWGQLTKLKVINLSENQLTGTIPTEIALLVALEDMFFDLNSLSGTIPTEIALLTELEKLSIHTNNFTGNISTIPWGQLVKLERMNITRNGLTGTIPTTIGGLTSLEKIDLSSNLVTGKIPSEIGLLTMTTDLRLGNNTLTGTICSEIGFLSELNHLSLPNGSLTGSIPKTIFSRLTDLERIDLSNNKLTGTIPPVTNLTKLKELHLYNNSLSGEFTCHTRIPDCYISCFVPGNDTCRVLG